MPGYAPDLNPWDEGGWHHLKDVERRNQACRDLEELHEQWRLVERSATFGLPFQIRTGHGRLQGSNLMLLLDLIEANPGMKFILFHGGYPWVGETEAIMLRHWPHVWVDSVWLPTISPTMARRAFHEWLEVMPSNRLLWGGATASTSRGSMAPPC